MRRAIHSFLSALPSKAFSGGIGVAGIIATLWPEKFRAWVSETLTADQVQFYGVIVLGVVSVYWLLMLALKPPPEKATAIPNAISTSGPNSQALNGPFHGPVTINNSTSATASPPDLSHNRSGNLPDRNTISYNKGVRRDVGLSEALAYAITGQWNTTFLDALKDDLSNAAPVSHARQLAFEGLIKIWGKRTSHGVYEEITREYWANYQAEWFSLLRGEAHTERTSLTVDDSRYIELMASKVEFEREWPSHEATTTTADELPDMLVRDLLERVANAHGIRDDGSIEALRQYREIAREMSDQFSIHAVTMWGRIDGKPLSRVDDDVSKLGFGVGRYADGKMYCTKIYHNGEGAQVWIDHLHVRKDQVDTIWPTTKSIPRIAQTLITAGRDWAHEFTQSADGDSFGFRDFLEGKRLFSDLRPHLSAEYMAKLNVQRTSYATADGAKYPTLVSWFLDEIDRLEDAWGLR